MQLHVIDYAIMAIYVGFVVGIGFALKRYMKTSADFFLSGHSIPAWVCGSDRAIYKPSLNININLVWGEVLFLFGVIMLTFALVARLRKPKQAVN